MERKLAVLIFYEEWLEVEIKQFYFDIDYIIENIIFLRFCATQFLIVLSIFCLNICY